MGSVWEPMGSGLSFLLGPGQPAAESLRVCGLLEVHKQEVMRLAHDSPSPAGLCVC